MVRRVATRSQLRTEKKQAVFILALVLIVALVSFVLGMMIGRSSSAPAVVAVAPQPARLPVAPPAPTPADVSAAIADHPAENLTFYDSLPKGGQTPLGSGINLPPAKAPAPAPAPAVADSVESARSDAKDQGTIEAKATSQSVTETPSPVKTATTRAPVSAPPPAPAAKAVSAVTPPPAVAAGGYLVQAAAFRRSEDAKALQAKLGRKGYSAFSEVVNLGEKGIWYRVYIGPFANAAAADAAVARLKAEEKLTALVRKR